MAVTDFKYSTFDDAELNKSAIEHQSKKYSFRDLVGLFPKLRTEFPFDSTNRLESALHFLKSLNEGSVFFPIAHNQRKHFSNSEHITTHEKSRLLLATSGTTGRQKIVCLTEDALLFSAKSFNTALKIEKKDKWLCVLPLNHIAGLSIFTRSLLSKTTVVLHESFSPKDVIEAIDSGVTLVSMVPTMLEKVFEHSNWSAPSHLKTILLGGAMITPKLLDEAKRRSIPITRSYGMTETASGIALDGIPFPGVELKTDGNKLLYIKSPSNMTGYLGSPDVKEWFKTQDLASIDNGTLKILGRSDFMILTGGENISPTDVESYFTELRDVNGVQAVGIPDETWGEVIGLMVATETPTKALEDIQSICKTMPSHLKPRQICYLQNFDLTELGKRKVPANSESLIWHKLT